MIPRADGCGAIQTVFARCPDYTKENLRPALESVLAPQLRFHGGVRGRRVLLKPNLLAWRREHDPACTDPQVIVESAKVFLDAGASQVAVMENPAVQSVPAILRAMGIDEELKKLNVPFAGFRDYRKTEPPEGVRFHDLEIASEYRDFDFTADLAKAKTHGMMTLTMCVKNLFGLVNGSARLGWHLSVGRDFDCFADMLLDLYLTIRPAFNILDAVVAMEGNGPGSGSAVNCGFLCGAPDALALDAAAAPVLGVDDLVLLKRAEKRGLIPDFSVTGDEIRIPPLILPDPPDTMLEWGLALPPLFRGFMREHLISKPVLDPKKCVGCGLCVKMCPPKSLRLQDGKPAFRYNECIRCYCCQEHCPKGAIQPKRSFSMRMLEAMERMVRAAFLRTGH